MKIGQWFGWGGKKDQKGSEPEPDKHAQAAPESPAPASTLPDTVELSFGKYRLEPFTEGGICVVMKGFPEDPANPRLSIKLVREQWLNHAAVRRQFSNESQIVRELNHPYMPKYRARGLIGQQAFYAYEYIDGFPLINLSQEQTRFPPALVRQLSVDITRQLLEQLDHIHSGLKPVIHGDISSENILIDTHQKIYLVDFGCSHFLKQANKESYQWIAKPSFISPEQAKGEVWDHRSDLYQAGILLYELIMNKRWNEGKSKREKVLFAASSLEKPEHFLAGIVEPGVSALVARLLHPDPDRRFQTAREALDAIARL
jgi:serine/threonine protein kinase